MSTYGAAVLIDVRSPQDRAVCDEFLRDAQDTFPSEAGNGWLRSASYFDDPNQLPAIEILLARLNEARAVLAEDFDDFGALWIVLHAKDGVVETIHRRYVLNADPDDSDDIAEAVSELDDDPRTHDVAGVVAATTSAELFGASVPAVVAAEENSGSAWEQIGMIGGPFPW